MAEARIAVNGKALLTNKEEGEIDLNKMLAGGENSYLLVVNCNAMIEAGIKTGDRIIVERGVQPLNGNIVIADIQGNLLIRRLHVSNGKMQLLPAGKLAPILFEYYRPDIIWGVVTFIIQKA